MTMVRATVRLCSTSDRVMQGLQRRQPGKGMGQIIVELARKGVVDPYPTAGETKLSISIRIPEDDMNLLRQMASDRRIGLGELVRRLLRACIKSGTV